MTITTADGTEFRDVCTVSGPFEAFCQPGYEPEMLRKVDKMAECEFCHSNYSPKNLTRTRRHESAACRAT